MLGGSDLDLEVCAKNLALCTTQLIDIIVTRIDITSAQPPRQLNRIAH
jgi:hypothetical protein